MKAIKLLLLTFIISVKFINAQSTLDVFNKKEMTWYGLDFSLAKFAGDFSQFNTAGFQTGSQIRDVYFRSWNNVVISEKEKYNFPVFFKKETVPVDLSSVAILNNKVCSDSIIVLAAPKPFSEGKIQEEVSKYDNKGKSGLGLVFIIESFDKISENRARVNYVDAKHRFSIGGEMNQISGYTYFDSTFSPKQFDSTLTIYSAFIQKDFHLKHFHFNNKITWQQASNEVIHLPQLVTNHSIYYTGKWFSKVMEVQIGFDVSFYSSYYADAYMPALGQYYLQNKKQIGNYPFIDFFFNMKVKHANVFFKSEHVNSGFMGAYYLAPHMPAPDRSFKVGIRWLFYD